jgi:hypothetical protein
LASNATFKAKVEVHLLVCKGSLIQKTWCNVQGSLSFFKALLIGKLVPEMLSRIAYAHVPKVNVSFSVLHQSELIRTDSTGERPGNRIERALTNFAIKMIERLSNSNSHVHNLLEAQLSTLGMKAVNHQIQLLQDYYSKPCVKDMKGKQ